MPVWPSLNDGYNGQIRTNERHLYPIKLNCFFYSIGERLYFYTGKSVGSFLYEGWYLNKRRIEEQSRALARDL